MSPGRDTAKTAEVFQTFPEQRTATRTGRGCALSGIISEDHAGAQAARGAACRRQRKPATPSKPMPIRTSEEGAGVRVVPPPPGSSGGVSKPASVIGVPYTVDVVVVSVFLPFVFVTVSLVKP